MNSSKTISPETNAPTMLRAGVGKRDITTESADAVVADRLYAKALVLDDGTTRLVLLTMDVTAIGARRISDNMLPDVSEEFLPRLRERVHAELGIPGQHVMVNASHTHPPGRMLVDDEAQLERTFDAIRQATLNMTEVRIGAGVGREERISINRNLKLKNGGHWTIRHANPCPPSDDVVGVGPHDPQIGILRVDRMDGTPLAVVYNFAVHLLFGDPTGKVTANIPGYASKLIEETLGHDAMAFFVQGAAGDVVDIGFKDLSRPRTVDPYGVMLGQSTLAAAREISTASGRLNVVARTIDLLRRTDIPERMAALHQKQDELLESLRSTTLNFESFLPLYLKHTLNPASPADYSYRYLQAAKYGNDEMLAMDRLNKRLVAKYLQNIRAMEQLGRIRENLDTLRKHQAMNEASGEPTIRAEIQGIRIGDFILVAAPLEVLTEVALNVKRASPHRYTFVAGFTNGYMHYGPPAADYDKGGYEVNECLLAPEWQRVFERTVAEILKAI